VIANSSLDYDLDVSTWPSGLENTAVCFVSRFCRKLLSAADFPDRQFVGSYKRTLHRRQSPQIGMWLNMKM